MQETFTGALGNCGTVACIRNRIVLAASLQLVVACSAEDLGREYRTQYASIDTTFDETLCAADFELVDRHIEEISSLLGVEPPQIEIVFTTKLPVEGCRSGATGCFYDGLVRARPESLRHELVHAVATDVGAPAKFWVEGLAVALDGHFHRRGSTPSRGRWRHAPAANWTT